LVRRLVELHGGTIMATSAGPGQGSEFIVRLPTLDSAMAAADLSLNGGAKAHLLPAVRQRILAVDDNVDAAQSLALLLKLQGHETTVAYDGPTALQAVQEFQPEVILLDIGLPRMDGYEVAKRLREAAGSEHLRIVAITGYGRDEDKNRSAAAGFDAHLVKPVDLEALSRLLRENKLPSPKQA
jgi:CheY-like chemotaxis protein